MNMQCPRLDDLLAALAANGHEAGLRKHVLDSGWWFIDESAPIRKRVPSTLPPASVAPAQCLAQADSPLHARLLDTARNAGWRVAESMIVLDGKRRVRAELFSVTGRGPSLCVGILPDACPLTPAAAAFVLRLTAFLRLVRASLMDFGRGSRLVWETPLDPDDDTEEQLMEALCCLADAVQHGQAEAEMLTQDEITAAHWIEMNFPATKQH